MQGACVRLWRSVETGASAAGQGHRLPNATESWRYAIVMSGILCWHVTRVIIVDSAGLISPAHGEWKEWSGTWEPKTIPSRAHQGCEREHISGDRTLVKGIFKSFPKQFVTCTAWICHSYLQACHPPFKCVYVLPVSHDIMPVIGW